MNCTPEELHENIVAAISRELHLADVQHRQETIHYSVFCLADDLPGDRQERSYDSETGELKATTSMRMGDPAAASWGTLFGEGAR